MNKAAKKKWAQDTKERRIAAGLCATCGKLPAIGVLPSGKRLLNCEACRGRYRLKMQRFHERQKQGKDAQMVNDGEATNPDDSIEWYAVIDQQMKIVYRGIDLELACGKLEGGRLFGKGATRDEAEAAARERMGKWIETNKRILLQKAAS